MVHDYATEAEALFKAFASRHGLSISKVSGHPVELLMTMPRQPGLSFELTLGLQNEDEVNIGFESFWSYFFPFREKRDLVVSALDGLMSRTCRLAVHRQFGRITKRVLELQRNGTWEPIYTAYGWVGIPLLGAETSYHCNEDAR